MVRKVVRKNWVSAMAVLFAIVATIILLRNIALWGIEFVLDFMINDQLTNEKFVLAMYGISIILFLYSKRVSND
jgi:hypothetical protein